MSARVSAGTDAIQKMYTASVQVSIRTHNSVLFVIRIPGIADEKHIRGATDVM